MSAHSHHPTPTKHRRLSLSFNEPYTGWRNFVELMILLPLQLPIAWHCCWRPGVLDFNGFFQPRKCLSSSWEMSFEFGMLVFDFCGCKISTYCQSSLCFWNFGADFKKRCVKPVTCSFLLDVVGIQNLQNPGNSTGIKTMSKFIHLHASNTNYSSKRIDWRKVELWHIFFWSCPRPPNVHHELIFFWSVLFVLSFT